MSGFDPTGLVLYVEGDYVADAVFLTGSGVGIAPVGSIDGHAIATTEHPHFAVVTAA